MHSSPTQYWARHVPHDPEKPHALRVPRLGSVCLIFEGCSIFHEGWTRRDKPRQQLSVKQHSNKFRRAITKLNVNKYESEEPGMMAKLLQTCQIVTKAGKSRESGCRPS